MPSCVRLAVGWEKTVNHSCGLRKRIAGLRLLADDAETLIGVRAVACDSEEDLALPLIEACSHLHGLDATAAFAMAEDSASAAESSKKAVARFWPTALVF